MRQKSIREVGGAPPVSPCIEGLVRSSMGDKSYAVNIAVDGSGNILNSSCGCSASPNRAFIDVKLGTFQEIISFFGILLVYWDSLVECLTARNVDYTHEWYLLA